MRTPFAAAALAALLCAACSENPPASAADASTPDAAPDVADAASAPDAGDDDITDELASLAMEHGLPALGGAVSDDATMLAAGVAGLRKIDDPTPVTLDDPFHLGSDTKAMTAVLIALHVEAGDLAWDATLPELFPSIDVDEGYADVTLAMLLTHEGGAPADFDSDIEAVLFGSGETTAVRSSVVELLLTRPPTSPIGAYSYSNAGYVLAGAALEQAVGTSWERLVEDELFAPLGMASCGFGPMATGTMVDGPWGHTLVGDELTAVNADNPAALGPAGTVHCALADWLAFLREHLRGARGQTTTLPISTATWMRLQAPASDQGNAFGWRVVERPWTNGPALVHLGSNTLSYADAWVVPGLNRVFVSVANRGDDAAFAGVDAAIAFLVTHFRPSE